MLYPFLTYAWNIWNIYNMDYLKAIFDPHVKGERDYAHLLGTIVGLELWFRAFVD